ncbi:hypothetical protein [Escherichia coli]|uniref:hypothetical protein n=1 Tax=Escherichia coli TaxID=562 RepID=UPI0021B1D938|nr:hypothetical protein [Escherichia coli]
MKKRYIFILVCILANIISFIYLANHHQNTLLYWATSTIIIFSLVFSPLLVMIATVEPEKDSFKK